MAKLLNSQRKGRPLEIVVRPFWILWEARLRDGDVMFHVKHRLTGKIENRWRFT